MTEALRLEHVYKRYSGHEAVRDLSLVVPAGMVYGILGPNGAGKSTTLRMVMNIISCDGGAIEVLGRAPDANGVLRRVGYLPEERGLYRKMRVLDVIVFFARLKGLAGPEARRRGHEWLERMGLGEWRLARVDTLSKGMQQKVQFITTVLHDPELLILDEPHSGLDPVNQEVLRETIAATSAAGRTVVLSTHNMNEAEALCDAVCIIAGGEKVLDGPVSALRRAHRGHRYRLRIEPTAAASELQELEALLARSTAGAAATMPGTDWEIEMTGRDPRALLGELARLPVQLERFERIEPTLHEIFLEHAGAGARRPERREATDA
jgi:ABC-2 type transport system ATP-binding protein